MDIIFEGPKGGQGRKGAVLTSEDEKRPEKGGGGVRRRRGSGAPGGGCSGCPKEG